MSAAKRTSEYTLKSRIHKLLYRRLRKFTTLTELKQLLLTKCGLDVTWGSLSATMYGGFTASTYIRKAVGARGGYGYRVWRNRPTIEQARECVMAYLYAIAPESARTLQISRHLAEQYFEPDHGGLLVPSRWITTTMSIEGKLELAPDGGFRLSPDMWLLESEKRAQV